MADESMGLQLVISAKDEASKKLDDVAVAAKNMALVAGAAGAAITGALGFAVNAAADAQVQTQKVESMLKTMGAAGELARDAINEAAGAATKLGFDDEEAALSITKLFQRTGDLTSSLKLNGLAMDLARAKNIDLATATDLVGQVLSGNGKLLKQYGIDINEAASPLEALDELQVKVAGSASDFAGTASGQMDILKVTLGNITEQIGGALLPVLSDLLVKVQPIIDRIADWINKNPELTGQIVMAVAAIGGLLLAAGALVPVIGGVSAAVGALGAVLAFVAASHVVLIIAGVAALIAAIVWLITHWDLVKQKTGEVWEWIKSKVSEGIAAVIGFFAPFVQGITEWFTKAWDGAKQVTSDAIYFVIGLVDTLSQAILGVSLPQLVQAFTEAWTLFSEAVKAIWQTVNDFLSTKWDGIKDLFSKGMTAIKDFVEKAKKPLTDAWDAIWGAMSKKISEFGDTVKGILKPIVDWIKNKLEFVNNSIKSIVDGAKGIGANIIQSGKNAVSAITGKAAGGPVSAGTPYIVGENHAEVFVPAVSGTIQPRGVGGTNINVTITGNNISNDLDLRDLGEKVGDAIIDRLKLTHRLGWSA